MPEIGNDSRLSDDAVRQAAAWFARLRAATPTEDVRREFRAWLAEDPEHHRAFAETKALWYEMDNPARHAGFDLWYREGLGQSARRRQRLMSLATAACAVALLCSAALWRDAGLIDRVMADYATSPGQQKEVQLADGSTAYLDGDSALDITMSAGARQIRLIRGRVWFDVAPDASRPFTVTSGAVETRVLGTAFSVESSAETVDITVERGHVTVSDVSGTRVDLVAGEHVAVKGNRFGEKAATDVESALAWRRGILVLNHTPIGEVAALLGRMSPGRVILRDGPVQADVHLSGVFKVDDPDAVVTALRSAGVQAMRVAGVVTIIY